MRQNRFAAYAWGVLAFNLAVIAWGAYVRASGAGAGCGNHWPLCNGEVVPRTGMIETMIELTHRLTSGIAFLLIVGLVIFAFRTFPKRHAVRAGAVLSLVFIIMEALIGAVLVKRELVAGNASMTRALVMSIHLINTFVLLAFIALTAWWGTGRPVMRFRGRAAATMLLTISLISVLVLAVSGAIAALGDTLFPSTTLASGLSSDFSPTAHLLIRLRLLHPVLALAVGGLVLMICGTVNFIAGSVWVRRWMLVVTGLVVLQLGAGLLNVVLLAPIWLQLVHLLLADLLWLALVLLTASALARQEAEVTAVEPQIELAREAIA